MMIRLYWEFVPKNVPSMIGQHMQYRIDFFVRVAFATPLRI